MIQAFPSRKGAAAATPEMQEISVGQKQWPDQIGLAPAQMEKKLPPKAYTKTQWQQPGVMPGGVDQGTQVFMVFNDIAVLWIASLQAIQAASLPMVDNTLPAPTQIVATACGSLTIVQLFIKQEKFFAQQSHIQEHLAGGEKAGSVYVIKLRH